MYCIYTCIWRDQQWQDGKVLSANFLYWYPQLGSKVVSFTDSVRPSCCESAPCGPVGPAVLHFMATSRCFYVKSIVITLATATRIIQKRLE